jgi:hypothetical protein
MSRKEADALGPSITAWIAIDYRDMATAVGRRH